MGEWNVCCIDDLGTVNRGKSKHRPRNDSILFGGLYPFIQTADVKKAILYITEYNETYSDIGLAQSKLWDKGTLCITIAANIAESAILGIDACFPDSVVGFIPHKGKADLKFVKYLLDEFKVYMQQISKGTTQDNLSLEKLRRVKFNVPEYNTQVKIANILSTYDDLIENNNRRIALLEKAAQELCKEWFVRFRFPGYKNAKFENGLPEGWERRKISAYYDTCSGGTPSRTHEEYFVAGIYPWVKTGEIKDCIIIDTEEYITKEAVKKSSAKLLPAKSVAMAMYGVNIGQLGYFDKQMTCNQACCVFSDKRSFSSKHYLFQYLKSIREYLLLISFGAAQQNLSQELIKKIKIVMPSDDVVRAFEEKVDAIYDSIKTLMYKNQNLAKQRDLLLPRLMSGKLEV